MSEFEIATLDYRAATLAARHAGLWIAAAHVFVGLLQAAVVGYGVYAMIRANRERAEAGEASAKRVECESVRRHSENMAALNALVDGKAEQRPESVAQRHIFDAQTRSLGALLEWTVPQRDADR